MEALLIVDAQVDMLDTHPAFDAEPLLGRLVALRVSAQMAGVPVVFVRNCGAPGEPDEPGTPGWEIHPALAPHPSDGVFDKHERNAFTNAALGDHLRGLGVDTVAIAGLQSEYCVASTALGAIDDGFGVVLVSDGHSTYDGDDPAEAIIARTNAELGAKARLEAAADLAGRWAG